MVEEGHRFPLGSGINGNEVYHIARTKKAKDPKSPNKVSLNIRIPEAMKAKIVEIPGWQDKVRAAIAQIIANQV